MKMLFRDYLDALEAIDDVVNAHLENPLNKGDHEFVRLTGQIAKRRVYELFANATLPQREGDR